PWLAWHIGGMGGSFIGVVTAGLFQFVLRAAPASPIVITLTFALPTIVGSVLIARAVERRTRRRLGAGEPLLGGASVTDGRRPGRRAGSGSEGRAESRRG